MCIQTRIQKILAEKEALDAQLQKLDQLETKTAPVKDLLSELLADYSDVAPEDLAGVWGEVLSIGQKFGLSVQPLAADELKAWEAANAENAKLKAEIETLRQFDHALTTPEKVLADVAIYGFTPEEALADAHFQIAMLTANYDELEDRHEAAKREIAELRSQLELSSLGACTHSLLPDLHDESEIWETEDIAPGLEKLYQEALTENTEPVSDSIPALTLWQPWATLIAEEIKCIETRSWATSYRGPLAIHAAKRPVYTGIPELLDLLQKDSEPPLGAVVAIANLIDCIEMTPEFIAQQSEQEIMCGDWQPGRFAWVLEIIRPIVPPIPATGGQKLWNWSGTSVAAELEYLAKLNSKPEPEYEPKKATDTVDSILESHGFFQSDADMPPDWDTSELYETYRGWDIFYSFPNGGIVAIGLNNSESNQFWDADTEYIQEIEGNTFPESLADYDEIVAWTKQLIDQVVAVTPVESAEVPGQLALEFPEPESETVLTGNEYDAAVEEELGCNWEDDKYETILITFQGQQYLVEQLNEFASGISILIQTKNREEGFTATVTRKDVENNDCSLAKCAEQVLNERLAAQKPPEPTELQKLLPENDYYHVCFEPKEIGGRYRVFVNIHSILEEGVEKAKIETGWLEGNSEKRTHCIHAQTFVCQYNDNTYQQDIRKMALTYAKRFLRETSEAETQVKEIGFKVPKFETMSFQVQVYAQHSGGENFIAATFRFLDAHGKFIFDRSLLKAELGDLTCKVVAEQLIADYQTKEADRLEKLANPYKKPEDDFVELVKISNDVGYLKQKAGVDAGKILAGYIGFAMKDANGEKLETLAKPRAVKWREYLLANNEASEEGKNSKLTIDEPRKMKRRLTSDNPKQDFSWELKLTGVDIEYLQRLSQQDFSNPPSEHKTKKIPTAKLPVESAPIYKLMVNGFQRTSGNEDVIKTRFETELKIFGTHGNTAITLMCGSEVVERYAVPDFHFVPAQDFDEENPEYWTIHKPTKTNFRVYRSLESGSDWVNSIYPYDALSTKEAAAVDAVRRLLKAQDSAE